MREATKLLKFTKKRERGITLIALVINFSRSKYCNINRRKWNIDKSTRGKE